MSRPTSYLCPDQPVISVQTNQLSMSRPTSYLCPDQPVICLATYRYRDPGRHCFIYPTCCHGNTITTGMQSAKIPNLTILASSFVTRVHEQTPLKPSVGSNCVVYRLRAYTFIHTLLTSIHPVSRQNMFI